MLTFCRRAACRAGTLVRRRHRLPPAAPDRRAPAALEHDYLALELPDPPAESAAAPELQSVDELAAALQRRRRGRPGHEAVIAATFGLIRLDDDNRPLVHGQFEPGLYEDGDESGLTAALADEPRQRLDGPWEQEPGAGVAARHCPADRDGQAGLGRESDRSGSRSCHSVGAADVGTAGDLSDPVAAGLVDDQYFPNWAVNGHQSQCDSPATSEPLHPSRDRLLGLPEDVFDEQYFSEAFQVEAADQLPLPKDTPLRAAEAADADPPAGGSDRLHGRPQGVFDEQYFWAAFEDGEEERETEAYKAGLVARHGEGLGSRMTSATSPGKDMEVKDGGERGERKAGEGAGLSLDGTLPGVESAPSANHRQPPRPAKPDTSSAPSVTTASESPPSRTNVKQLTRSPAAPSASPPVAAAPAEEAPTAPAGRRSALDVVRELRATSRQAASSVGRGRKLRAEAPDLSSLSAAEVLVMLRRGVLHDADDFIVLYKPAGLSVHSATGRHPHQLVDLLPALARHVHCARLFTVHRLDRDTSGALLLAKTPAAAHRLSALLREGRVTKTYWALVRGAPDLPHGIIDIPVKNGVVGGRERVTLAAAGGGATPPGARRAVTRYRVLARGAACALLELTPETGVRHQLRVHLGLGLGCPVLGDHKFSRWETAMRPQRLPPAALAALGLRAPEARHLPLHLHARAIWFPGLVERVVAPLPLFFKRNIKRLKMASGKVKADGSNYADS